MLRRTRLDGCNLSIRTFAFRQNSGTKKPASQRVFIIYSLITQQQVLLERLVQQA